MRKLFNWLFMIPLAAILILLSVANRRSTVFSLDPLNTETPALAVEMPLFVLLFLAVFAGMLVGGLLTWLSQGKHRKALREKEFEARELKREKEAAEISPPKDVEREIAPGLPLISRS